MAFTLPTFNLTFQAKANYNWAAVGAPAGPYILAGTPCNLAYSRRVHAPSGVVSDMTFLLFPSAVALKGKDSYVVKNGDAIEVPQASGRWYSVFSVDRVGAGFSNEHQAAILYHPYFLYPTTTYLWPAP